MEYNDEKESSYVTVLFKLAREISEIKKTSARNRTPVMRNSYDSSRSKFIEIKLKLDNLHINKGNRPLNSDFFFI